MHATKIFHLQPCSIPCVSVRCFSTKPEQSRHKQVLFSVHRSALASSDTVAEHGPGRQQQQQPHNQPVQCGILSHERHAHQRRAHGFVGHDQWSTSPFLAEARFASLSRVLLVGQPGYMFRTLTARKWPSTVGPISLLVFLFGTILALFAAVRGVLVRKVKSCKCCKGFGVVRCRLCDGRGTVDWRAKFSYSETCPLCAAKRFVVCPDCGGHYHRRLFNHAKDAKGTLETFFPGPGSGVALTRSNALD